MNKNDLFDEVSVVACRAWRSVFQMLAHIYDQKAHQAALLVMKTIAQNLVRKLDKEVQSVKKMGH